FRYSYKLVDVLPIQNCNQEIGIGDHVLHDCDLFIYMKTGDAYGERLSSDYLLSKLPPHCKKISIGNAYFKSYYPQFTYNNQNTLYGYEDQNVLRLVKRGESKERIVAILSDEQFYSAKELQMIHNEFMYNLRQRENDIDIPLANFIEQHYQKE